MDELERYRRRQAQKWKALRRLGVRNVRCACGETDPICFEADHIERRKNSDTVWGLCKNCHAKVTARQMSEHPAVGIGPGDPSEQAHRALLGAADYLEFIVPRLREIAELIKLQDAEKTPKE